MTAAALAWLGAVVAGGPRVQAQSGPSWSVLFDRGVSFETFVRQATVQGERWRMARTPVPPAAPDVVSRLRASGRDLRLLVVAEDWCVDSVNTLPHLARLADAAGVPLRIVDRTIGRAALEAHRTRDGRTATPLVVLLRAGGDAGAWVERPEPLQRAFREMATSASAAETFGDRQAWYDRDAGRSALEEIVALAEGRRQTP